jgi:hypothetical protein
MPPAGLLLTDAADTQLGALLTDVLAIPLAHELPTPNARKTHSTAVWLLQAQRLPARVLAPAAPRIAYALRRGIDGELGKEGKKGAIADGLKVRVRGACAGVYADAPHRRSTTSRSSSRRRSSRTLSTSCPRSSRTCSRPRSTCASRRRRRSAASHTRSRPTPARRCTPARPRTRPSSCSSRRAARSARRRRRSLCARCARP